ncbi:chemotaxis protein methyltransferase CheR [Verrucomicrobium sp. GAS474]|uniref:CheR family methyltransferase n=1 Tax=Verrucomicrobium sp. GAS474 TaxID=1882831 RepID=UPI00087B4D6E|nr:protein-glutamate O-methyltransferase CheR [Verrucomicrobium sp. GAS474]SDT85733.1 chemotaxis protein methyltransferase CheR [Verrucomicrobium sp. GAS474]
MQLSDQEYERIRKLVYEYSRIDLGPNKRELVTARLGKRLRATKIESFSAYIAFLDSRNGQEELTHLIDAISTNHTFFFREIKHFEFMEQTVLPWALAEGAKHGKKSFRVWSAASSSGEEPYSVAIHLTDYFRRNPGWTWKVEATDISTKILAQAREAVYAEERLRDVRPDWMKTYFQRGIDEWTGYYRVREEARKQVNFTHINLLQPKYPFTEPFQLIWCRNVMIYFDRPTQEQLVAKLSEVLVPGGYLFIGHSESLTGIKHGLKAIRPAIYQKPL